MSICNISPSQVTPQLLTILLNEHMFISSVYATFRRKRKHMIKANLETLTRCKISITRNNLLDGLCQMLKVSDEIDLKPSLRACSRGRDFISVSYSFLEMIFFSNMCFFSNSLNEKRMNGRSKIFGKKDRSPCLFKSK